MRTTMFFAAAVLTAGSAQARLLDLSESNKIGDAAAARWKQQQPVTRQVKVVLESQGIRENQAKQILDGIDKRAAADLRDHAATFENTSLNEEQVAASMAAYERVLRYNVTSSPRAYALGRPMPFVITDPQAQRFAAGLAATWIEHERPLRSKVDELVMMGDLDPKDAPAVRALAREQTLATAKSVVAAMRGAAFFSETDADYFLESTFDECIDRIVTQKLDEHTRAGYIEEAKMHYQVGSSTVGFSSEMAPRRVAGAGQTR